MKSRRSLLFAGLLFSGCDLSNAPPVPYDKESLKSFTSEQEFRDYLQGELAARSPGLYSMNRGDSALPEADADSGIAAVPFPAPSQESLAADGGGSGSGYSQTTIQEAGVDEGDVVKNDGTFIYMIDDSTGEHSTLRIVRAVPSDQVAVVSETALDGYGREIYLHDGKVVALTATYGGFFVLDQAVIVPPVEVAASDAGDSTSSGGADESFEGKEGEFADSDVVIDIAPLVPSDDSNFRFERPHVTATVIDVADPTNPRVLSQTKFDGSPSSNRMIGGMLHLVLANYQNYYFDILPALGRPEFNPSEVETANLLPRFERTDAAGNVTSGDLVTWQDVYRPSEPDGFGVVTVVSVDVNQDASLKATGIVAEPGMLYSSPESLYMTNTDYGRNGDMRGSTKIYKLRYADGRAVPAAAGTVPGRILNQYSMSEHKGVLRVATTVDPVFSSDGTMISSNNNVYCLSEASGGLDVIGRVENIAPRETIQSARFVGDRGFVVTFEQIDPLFTLDLSDPTNPRIVGELKVPGFSTFMVPIDDNHILAVGQYIPDSDDEFRPWAVQLSIFDVTDFAAPVQRHNVVLGAETGAWSEALYDPKALTYFASGGLLALPINIYPRYDYVSLPEPVLYEDDEFAEGEVKPDGDVVAEGGGTSGSGMTEAAGDTGIATDVPFFSDPGFEGVIVFRVSAEGGFTEVARINTRFEAEGYYSWTSFARGVFISDTVHAVTNLGIRSLGLSTPSASPSEIFYGQRYPEEPFPYMDDPKVDEAESNSSQPGLDGSAGSPESDPEHGSDHEIDAAMAPPPPRQ